MSLLTTLLTNPSGGGGTVGPIINGITAINGTATSSLAINTPNAAQGQDIDITAGNSTTGNNSGGNLNLATGNGLGSGGGGDLSAVLGSGGLTGEGGSVAFNAGDGGATSGAGGGATLAAGSTLGGSAQAGIIALIGGSNFGTGLGGDVAITAGSTSGGGNAGNIIFTPGTANTGGTNGACKFSGNVNFGLNDGELLIGHTGTNASKATLTSGAGITILNGTGSITLSENPVNATKPAFLAFLSTTVNNVTGNGTPFTLGSGTPLTEVIDQANNFNPNGTFTAPVTGQYQLDICIGTTGATNTTTYTLNLITTGRTYTRSFTVPPGPPSQSLNLSVLAPMNINDTATATIVCTGEISNSVDIVGAATLQSYFSGFLAC